MNLYVKLKSAGKRRPVLDNIPYNLPGNIHSLRQLLEAIIIQETEKYNRRGTEKMIVPFLTETEIIDQNITGKIEFGRLYSDKKADPGKSLETALQAFKDGLVRVVINETEITDLDKPLIINENDSLVFIRLAFLAGRLW